MASITSYKNYKDYDSKVPLKKDKMVLMSGKEFDGGGKNLIGVPTCITPDGSIPILYPVESSIE